MNDFILDLDAYFCERYEGYDKLSVLPGYKMPLMQASETDDFGRTRTYTLPANTMRLATQEKKDEILVEFKKRICDLTFSFSFRPVGFFGLIKAKCSKYAFYKALSEMMSTYNVTDADVLDGLDVSEEIWKKIRKGAFLPTKNLLFSFALLANLSFDDAHKLLVLGGYDFDYSVVKDVVIGYLLEQKAYNLAMREAAFAEYKITNLFLK